MADMTPAEIAAQIATSPETQAVLINLADQIASDASRAADDLVNERHKVPAEFGTDVTVGSDAARAHVWAKNGAAIHAERKAQVLVAAANQYGKAQPPRKK